MADSPRPGAFDRGGGAPAAVSPTLSATYGGLQSDRVVSRRRW